MGEVDRQRYEECEPFELPNGQKMRVYLHKQHQLYYVHRPDLDTLVARSEEEYRRVWTRFLVAGGHETQAGYADAFGIPQQDVIDDQLLLLDFSMEYLGFYSSKFKARVWADFTKKYVRVHPRLAVPASPLPVEMDPLQLLIRQNAETAKMLQELWGIKQQQAVQQQEIAQHAQFHKHHDHQDMVQTQRLDEHDMQLSGHEARLLNIEGQYIPADYYTALGFCREYRIGDPLAPQRLGAFATKEADRRRIELYSVPDKRWGKVNAYPKSLLEACARDYGLL